MSTKIICSACGETCSPNDRYCKNCNASLKEQTPITFDNSLLEGIDYALWNDFIEKNADRYISVFKKSNGKRWFSSFNWCAFLFSIEWLLYRKMYKIAILSAIITAVSLIFISLMKYIGPLGILLGYTLVILLKIVISFFGDALYKSHVKKEISKEYPDKNKGGTSLAAVIFGSIGLSIFLNLFVYLILKLFF